MGKISSLALTQTTQNICSLAVVYKCRLSSDPVLGHNWRQLEENAMSTIEFNKCSLFYFLYLFMSLAIFRIPAYISCIKCLPHVFVKKKHFATITVVKWHPYISTSDLSTLFALVALLNQQVASSYSGIKSYSPFWVLKTVMNVMDIVSDISFGLFVILLLKSKVQNSALCVLLCTAHFRNCCQYICTWMQGSIILWSVLTQFCRNNTSTGIMLCQHGTSVVI